MFSSHRVSIALHPDPELAEEALDGVRREYEFADSPQGVQMAHSISGKTGSFHDNEHDNVRICIPNQTTIYLIYDDNNKSKRSAFKLTLKAAIMVTQQHTFNQPGRGRMDHIECNFSINTFKNKKAVSWPGQYLGADFNLSSCPFSKLLSKQLNAIIFP